MASMLDSSFDQNSVTNITCIASVVVTASLAQVTLVAAACHSTTVSAAD